jgi:hypothetical protein
MQFTLRYLFVATACVAIATYALIYATPFWAVVAYTLCILLLLGAIVCAAAATGRARFYWLGFATFGWGYWIVLHSSFLDRQATPHNWQVNYEGPPLVSRMVSDWIYSKVLPLVHKPPQWDPTGRRTTNNSRFPSDTDFAQVCHSQFALLFSLLGGAVGSFAHWRYRRDQ